VNVLSLCGAGVNDFLHMFDKPVTIAVRELPNLTPWESWQQAIESNGPGCITDSGAFEHATTHQKSDTALYFVRTDLVCGPSRPCRLRQL
jgi:hypothetical protein